ncbi:MAG: YdcF family protein [Hyphomicrobiaceae bacterium]|nr:YdcF family protein [Hyphomicrobiaceae bacterium]
MFYALSKIVYFFVQPSSLFAIAILAGLVLARSGRWGRSGRGLAFAGIAALAVAGLSPLGNALVLPLEQRFPALDTKAVPRDVAGLIILGGFEDSTGLSTRVELGLNESAERLTESARLAIAEPRLKVVFTGGVGRLVGQGVSAADRIGDYLAAIGIDRGRMILETGSRNTFENAKLTIPLLKTSPGERWLLVTSAYHMPRAMGIFRRAGLDVVAFPVDYRTEGPKDLWTCFTSIPAGLERVDLATKEWLGLVAYRLMGYTNALFPGP